MAGEVSLSGFPLHSREWVLAGASARRDGYPFVHLRFDSTTSLPTRYARLDLGKRMLVDPLPESVSLSDREIEQLSVELEDSLFPAPDPRPKRNTLREKFRRALDALFEHESTKEQGNPGHPFAAEERPRRYSDVVPARESEHKDEGLG